MKKLMTWLRGKKQPWNKNKTFRLNGSHGAVILEKLCEGEWMGAREACIATKSHNGLRRLNSVKKMLRRHAIAYWQQKREAKSGRTYKLIQILPCDRERARKLILGTGAR